MPLPMLFSWRRRNGFCFANHLSQAIHPECPSTFLPIELFPFQVFGPVDSVFLSTRSIAIPLYSFLPGFFPLLSVLLSAFFSHPDKTLHHVPIVFSFL